jgi:hypothetical protein
MRLTFLEAMPHAPTLFRYIVLEEESYTCPLMIATRKLYVAVAMEWYQTAQGETPEKAILGLEQMLLCNAAIAWEHPGHAPRPSPEDYQRVATSGDRYTNPDPRWQAVCGTDHWPIVARGTIDMAKSEMRLVLKSDGEKEAAP